MSSTYVHYSTPSSLPSDYAILSRYAPSQTPEAEEDTGEISEEEEAGDRAHLDIPSNLHVARRRTSFPTMYIKPPNPPGPAIPGDDGSKSTAPTEYTPLLIPRIQEEGDDEVIGPDAASSLHAFWEEFRILLKYTLPVYGCVLPISFVVIQGLTILRRTGLICSSIP